ncbi:hypothetical protein CFC21_100409 [Triticum aestivum]|uniref:Late embryogenesis abundant protein LEA-2 subgroup domain-containing protein n=2 Tax=Triticum aestivum TaxID=4565 RepID=A0A3B6RS25_WHEAT|nr:hypothetical protein CFC21_100409 [Triticum aestivum]
MPTTSGTRSSLGNFSRRLRDSCCDLRTQRDTSSSLTCLFRYAFPALVVSAVTVLLVLRFAVAPQIKAYVEDARLNSFALAGTRASFSASVALTVRNLNGAMDITYTRPLVATFLFHDRRLYNVTVADEGPRHKPLKREAYLLHTGGEGPYVLDDAAAEEFEKQNATGVFEVEMRLSGAITLGLGNNRGLELSCPLTLQHPEPGPDVVVFHEIDCEPDRPKKIVF